MGKRHLPSEKRISEGAFSATHMICDSLKEPGLTLKIQHCNWIKTEIMKCTALRSVQKCWCITLRFSRCISTHTQHSAGHGTLFSTVTSDALY